MPTPYVIASSLYLGEVALVVLIYLCSLRPQLLTASMYISR